MESPFASTKGALSRARLVPELKENTFCYDLMYSDGGTIFTEWAIGNGASQAVDGLGMLVEQAAESYKIWHGIEPDTKSVIKFLKDQ